MCENHHPIPSETSQAGDPPSRRAGSRPTMNRRALLTTGVVGAASLLALRSVPGTASAGIDGVVGESQVLSINRSGNRWPVPTTNSPSVIGIRTFVVPSTSSVRLSVSSGAAATILLHVATRFHAIVEPLQSVQCGAYAWRANVNNPSSWSNHASGTAIDLNWSLHPNGRKYTFTEEQVRAIRAILDETQGVIRWGGDYTGTTDEMHFEINRTRVDPLVGQVANSLRVRFGAAREQGFAAVSAEGSTVGPDGDLLLGEVTVPGGPGTADGVHPD